MSNDRAARAGAFVTGAGWGAAARSHLAGDASARSYQRLVMGDARAVLMDAPPHKGEDTRPFVTMAHHLRDLGLSAPKVLAEDETNGFLLLEDLGDELYARVLEKNPAAETTLYAAAVDILARIQTAAPPPGIPDHTPGFMANAAGLAMQWYAAAILGQPQDPTPIVQEMARCMAAHCTARPVLVLRDYHAENLLWLPDRQGDAKVGLLDFQMGSMGQPEYDLISLLQDARRDVATDLHAPMIARFAEATGADLAQTETACAVLGAQRALRILGGFTRLSLHFGKPGYVRLIPRVWAHLQKNLQHPALSDLRDITAQLPIPDDKALKRIVDLCGTVPAP